MLELLHKTDLGLSLYDPPLVAQLIILDRPEYFEKRRLAQAMEAPAEQGEHGPVEDSSRISMVENAIGTSSLHAFDIGSLRREFLVSRRTMFTSLLVFALSCLVKYMLKLTQ